MTATLSPITTMTPEGNTELLLITHPTLRANLLQARLVDDLSARCVVQRGEQVYLSLREIADPAQRLEVNWAVVRLQMGAKLQTQELPEPLKSALTAVSTGFSPLLEALVWGSAFGVVGGVLVMAIVRLIITISTVPPESYVGIMATAIAFVFAGAVFGLSATFYFWRKLAQRTADSPIIHSSSDSK